MSDHPREIPPDRIWIPVWDLSSALLALEFLINYVLHFDGETTPSDYDEV